MKIWSYAVAWNEEKMLEFYLRHYSKFCDKMIFFDNESDDNSHEIINSYPNTEIRSYHTGGKFDDNVHMDLKHFAIGDAAGNCDYAIIGDCDEFIHHPNLTEFLKSHLWKTAIFYPAGYQMASHEFPNNNTQIYDSIKNGAPSPWYSKPILINPNMLQEFKWVGGQHEIDLESKYSGEIYHPIPVSVRPVGEYEDNPWGRWKIMDHLLHIFKKEPLKLLHYKFIGTEYVANRHKQYIYRNSEFNIEHDKGGHYMDSNTFEKTANEIQDIINKSDYLDLN
tara:strand:+ start:194 stop:1030 length:837 start_codon:yes stop_codon:yes gene_type:complete